MGIKMVIMNDGNNEAICFILISVNHSLMMSSQWFRINDFLASLKSQSKER